jgi:hypothetical protein
VKVFFISILAVFTYSIGLSQQNQSSLVPGEDDQPAAEILIKKATVEGKTLFLRSAWLNNLSVPGDYLNLPLETMLDSLLPRLGLKYLKYPPGYYVIVKDLLQDNGVNHSLIDTGASEQIYYSFDPSNSYTITGTVSDLNDEAVIGATLFVKELNTGGVTNEFGSYTLTLPSALYHLSVNSIGYNSEAIELPLVSDTVLNISLFDKSTQLEEIIIYDQAEDKNVSDISMGITRLNIQTLKSLPPLMGEVDVLRSLLLLPGVTTVGEGATGFNVRGGSVDQNLVLIEGAPVFNTSHFFGFFTAFSSLAVKDVTISRGGIPAQFGGRISSVVDVKIRQGNKNRIHGEGGIGLITSSLILDGPINRDKTTFLFSGRATPSDWVLRSLPDNYLKNSHANFHDFIGKVTHKFNASSILAITGYTSLDKFKFPGDTIYGWNNNSASLKWSLVIDPKLSMINSLVYSNYNYTVWGTERNNGFQWKAGVDLFSGKSEFNFNPDFKNRIDFGIDVNKYSVQLGSLSPYGENSNVNRFILDPENALETSLFYSHELSINPELTVQAGLRYTYYAMFGPGIKRIYNPDLPRRNSTVTGQVPYGQWELMEGYGGFEPRFSLRKSIGASASLKASYNRMKQFIHLISNTSAVSPVDIWKLSDPYIKPQTGDQVTAGIFKNLKSNTYETSLEVFYKYIVNVIDYKDGADLVLNRNLETEILNGNLRSYGAEVLIRKNKGRFNGWISYTLSRTEARIDNPIKQEKINLGNYYPLNYDKLHDLAVVGNYNFTRRHSLGFNFVLYSGRPITYPVGSYGQSSFLIADFENRNNDRIPSYHRLDISFTRDGNHKKDKKWHGSWTFSVYNFYARKNPYSIFFKARGYMVAQAFRLSVIGTMIPSLTYNFRF